MMKDTKEVLKYCPNFYKIVNFDSECEDGITSKIIDLYRHYIFNIDINNKEDIELVKEIDSVLNKYIDDYSFRKVLQEKIFGIRVLKNTTNVIKAIVKSIIDIFDDYEEYTTRVIYISRWI